MILEDYYNPAEHELEEAFREIHRFAQGLPYWAKIFVWLACVGLKDKLYAQVAQEMHRATMSTLQDAASHMHDEFFKRKREERRAIKEMGRGFVKSTVVE